jgi:hypothetical protein
MSNNNKIVNALWIGKKLSVIEILCINSFINNGHSFQLWLYEKLETDLPKSVIERDANTIIPESQVFNYKNKNQFGHGKGSYAGFSDIFRYKLLHDLGGWWTDMDVICLKYLDFTEEYVFRTHHDFPVIGNIMKCPKDSPLMMKCYIDAVAIVDEQNTDWNLPIKILNNNIKSFNLESFIKDFSNKDDWNVIKKLILKDKNIQSNWYIVHLLNEEWRRYNINKNSIPKNSFIGNQIRIHLKSEQVNYSFFRAQKVKFQLLYTPINKPNIYQLILKIKWFFVNTFWRSIRLIQKKVFNIHKT